MTFMLKHEMINEGQSSFIVFKHFIGKLQSHFPSNSNRSCGDYIRHQGQAKVPEDVKAGHFAVLAAKTEKPQRFIVELQFLNNPAFLSLLKRAEEEYGFEQKGVLAVPCRPEELQKILLH